MYFKRKLYITTLNHKYRNTCNKNITEKKKTPIYILSRIKSNSTSGKCPKFGTQWFKLDFLIFCITILEPREIVLEVAETTWVKLIVVAKIYIILQFLTKTTKKNPVLYHLLCSPSSRFLYRSPCFCSLSKQLYLKNWCTGKSGCSNPGLIVVLKEKSPKTWKNRNPQILK